MKSRIRRHEQVKGIKREFGNRIIKARQKARVTQSDLALKMGIDIQELRDYENGLSTPSPVIFAALVRVLETSPKFFFGRPKIAL